VKRCRHCGRTVWEQISGAPPNPLEGTGIYYHHHNGCRECFPYQQAEVDEDNPAQEWPVEPEPELVGMRPRTGERKPE